MIQGLHRRGFLAAMVKPIHSQSALLFIIALNSFFRGSDQFMTTPSCISNRVGLGQALSRQRAHRFEHDTRRRSGRAHISLSAREQGTEAGAEQAGAGGQVSWQSFTVAYEHCWTREDFVNAEPGIGVESAPFELGGHRWQTLVYPAGQQRIAGFGPASGFLGPSHSRRGRVGVYLRFLPEEEGQYVDAQFALTVKGHQQAGPRFDVSFECGMRFCEAAREEPSDGRARDWGAHVLPREALPDFLEGEDGTFRVEVNMTVFGEGNTRGKARGRLGSAGGVQRLIGDTVLKAATAGLSEESRRKNGVFWSAPEDVRAELRVGQVFVPTQQPLSPTWLFNRRRMFRSGLYPGVEYRIMGMRDTDTGARIFRVSDASRPGAATVTTRPIYPVTKQLERVWPVEVPLRFAPVVLTQAMYNTATLISTTVFCVLVLGFGLVGREAVSIYKIPSLSMDPTIMPSDLVLTEKVTARLGLQPRRGEVVFFSPPEALKQVVAKNNGRLGTRDLFVKRVGAVPGDRKSVV